MICDIRSRKCPNDMSTIFALDTRFHADSIPLPSKTTLIPASFGGVGTFRYEHPPHTSTRVVQCTSPYGDTADMIEAHGGSHMAITDIPIHPEKNYRFCVWLKRSSFPCRQKHRLRHGSNHSTQKTENSVCDVPPIRFGIGGSSCVVSLRGDSSSDGWMTDDTFKLPHDDWVLLVGYLHSHLSCRTIDSGASYYCKSKRMHSQLPDCKQTPPLVGKRSMVRNMQFRFGLSVNCCSPSHHHGSSNAVYFFYPRIDEVTGEEVSVTELLCGYGYNLFVKGFPLPVTWQEDKHHLQGVVSPTCTTSEDRGCGLHRQCCKITNLHNNNNNTLEVTERGQLNVALDKLCEIDGMLERYLTLDNITDKIRVIDLGEVSAFPDTIVKRDGCGGIQANTLKVESLETDTVITTSDRRIKHDIIPEPLGLDFIERLQPVRYRKVHGTEERVARCKPTPTPTPAPTPAPTPTPTSASTFSVLESTTRQDDLNDDIHSSSVTKSTEFGDIHKSSEHSTGDPAKNGRKCSDAWKPTSNGHETGLIAQDVQNVLQSLGYNWSGHCVSSDGLQGIQYGMLTVPLVNAVKQLANDNRELRHKIETLERRLQALDNEHEQ